MYEKMMDDVIKKFGFEDSRTILFFGMVEYEQDAKVIETQYRALMDEG